MWNSPKPISLSTMKAYSWSLPLLTLTFQYYATTNMLQLLCLASGSTNNLLHPIILVPGSGGNQLEARLTPEYNPSGLICKSYPGRKHKDKDGWYGIWFDPTVLLAPYTKCFAERMTLYYDFDSDDFRNAPGVQTRVPHFGSTRSLLYLDPNLKTITSYMEPLVKSLEQVGYIEGKTLFGAPYDFRYGLAIEGRPCHVGSKYLQQLKDLIQNVSVSNGGNPVIILSHSLGGLYVHQLLLQNTLSWRLSYIKHFIALSTPWGGTVQEMLTFASGYTLGVPLVKPLLVRDEQRSSESNLWVMPRPSTFGGSKPLVITPNMTYTANDIPNFLLDIGFPQGVYPYKMRILPLVEKLRAPMVPITCIVGSGVESPETLFYDKRGFDVQPSIAWGDGDGTVNMVSLLAVEDEWRGEKNQSLEMIKMDGVSHTSILTNPGSLRQILGVVSRVNSHVVRSNVLVL